MSRKLDQSLRIIRWIAFDPAAGGDESSLGVSLCLSGPLGRAHGETVVQQDDRPADRLRPGHYQPEGRRAGKGETNICDFTSGSGDAAKRTF